MNKRIKKKLWKKDKIQIFKTIRCCPVCFCIVATATCPFCGCVATMKSTMRKGKIKFEA